MIKDKNGRNFIPVAEDYIRKGLLDEAIDLLKEGVERYPGYLSARVSLGKAYLEKGLINEAMQEFETVVRVSPDNLLAHRKLALIYQDAGRTDAAIKACDAVLIFSPKDKEIADLLRTLKKERIDKSHQSVKPDEQKLSGEMSDEVSTIDFTSGWEVAAEESKSGEVSGVFLTESMGDLYVAQGEIEKGIDIYQRILQKEPDNESVRGKLMNLGEISSPPLVKGGEGGFEIRESRISKLGDFLGRVRINRR